MAARNYRRRKFINALMQVLTCGSALVVVVPLLLVFYHVLKSGLGAINWAFFTQLPKPVGEPGGGMANAIVGTFELLGLAALLGVPVGVLGGIYLSEYGSRRLNWAIRFGADVLNGVPSIIWGMVVWVLVVVPSKTFSALAGGIVLGVIMIPLIMRTTEEVLRLVPGGYREAALALGIAQWRAVLQIVVRTALKGIVTGVLLAVARVAGETAPLLFTAFGNRYWNHHLSEPIAALPLQIFSYAISPYEDWNRQAWAGALVLLLFVAIVNVGVRMLTRDRLARGG
ncbi:MAG TPA: phosphate ABC transporter permease PstA [Patescibacteria group bacterium]|nr:phosphate ABC transporter permease PstA [Patescibacteria group bacterium]